MKRDLICLHVFIKDFLWVWSSAVMVVTWHPSLFTVTMFLLASWVRFDTNFLDGTLYGWKSLIFALNILFCLAVCTTHHLVSAGGWVECTFALSSPRPPAADISSSSQLAWNSCKSFFDPAWCKGWSCLVSGYRIWVLSVWSCSVCCWWRFWADSRWKWFN